jgi:hypothetical protein
LTQLYICANLQTVDNRPATDRQTLDRQQTGRKQQTMQTTAAARESYSTAEKARIAAECAYQTARIESSAADRIHSATRKAHGNNPHAYAVMTAAAAAQTAADWMEKTHNAKIVADVNAKVARIVFENVMYANSCSALERFSAAVQMFFIPRN